MADSIPPRQTVTALLEQSCAGRPAATEELLTALYAELHDMAAAALRGERAGHTLQPTALVNEAYLRLIGSAPIAFENRAHFFGTAARCMRQILIHHAEARMALKRGGSRQRVTLVNADTPAESSEVDLLMLNEALQRLEQLDPRQCRVIELRFFAGLSVEETAGLMGISARTVELDWRMARAWLALELAV